MISTTSSSATPGFAPRFPDWRSDILDETRRLSLYCYQPNVDVDPNYADRGDKKYEAGKQTSRDIGAQLRQGSTIPFRLMKIRKPQETQLCV